MPNRIQEWFDQMVKGLAAQQWQRALGSDGTSCQFRAEDGKKCAVGQIIPDTAPAISENVGLSMQDSPSTYQSLGLGEINAIEEKQFLCDAQRSHDTSKTPDQMRTAFEQLAKVYGLDFPIIT